MRRHRCSWACRRCDHAYARRRGRRWFSGATIGRRRAAGPNSDVFINCPFDDEYQPCFEALLFAITISGYRARCALEENDAGDIRFDKLRRLIAQSDYTVHDLSRIQLGTNKLPRFNMPFELGLMMGAKHFGGAKQRAKRACRPWLASTSSGVRAGTSGNTGRPPGSRRTAPYHLKHLPQWP